MVARKQSAFGLLGATTCPLQVGVRGSSLQGRQGMCGSLAGWFQVAIQAVDWFVPEHHLSMYWFKVSFLRGVSPRSTDLGDWLGSA